TVVAAMIIAPLMNPIISFSYSLVHPRKFLLSRSTLTLVTGVFIAIFLSWFVTTLSGRSVVSEEILQRTTPQLLDLGIALCSGVAGGLAYSRRSIATSLPGVAIAVALVPPLCIIGIGLAVGNSVEVDAGLFFSYEEGVPNLVLGAALLFLTNLIAIILCCAFVFVAQGYSNWRRASITLLLMFACLLGILSPLQFQSDDAALEQMIFETLVQSRESVQTDKEIFADVTAIKATESSQEIEISLQLVAPFGSISQKDVARAQNNLAQELGKAVYLKVQLFPFQEFEQTP
ncbi:MAG: DUF389 domain-containing protein, partial [Cyanobacteria bacterium P01_H01_bin.15]